MKVRNVITRTSALLLVMFFMAVAAQAQPVRIGPEPSEPEMWKKHFGKQLAVSLASPITEIKIIALENTAFFASRHDSTLNLKPAIPALSKIHRKDQDERCRLLAAADLQYIGDFESMMKLRDGLRFQHSKAVQWFAVGALLDYFGTEYITKDKEMMDLSRSLVRYYKNRPLPIPKEKEKKVPEPPIARSKP